MNAPLPLTPPQAIVDRIAATLRGEGVTPEWSDEIARSFTSYLVFYDPRDDDPPHQVAAGIIEHRLDHPGAGLGAEQHSQLPPRESVPRLARAMVDAALDE